MNHSSEWARGSLTTLLWDPNEIASLPFIRSPFNDSEQVKTWNSLGLMPRTGAVFDMRNEWQPTSTARLLRWADQYEHVGISYYRMDPGDNLPYHSDTYDRYIKLYGLQDRRHKIMRTVFFVTAWKPGHIFEIAGEPITKYSAGTFVSWWNDVPHMAANLGEQPRYTIQLTGVLREDQ